MIGQCDVTALTTSQPQLSFLQCIKRNQCQKVSVFIFIKNYQIFIFNFMASNQDLKQLADLAVYLT